LTTSLPIVLKTKKILLIGAGAVAKQKLEVLNANGYLPKIIASQNVQKLDNVECKEVRLEDMQGFDIVIDATGSKGVREIVFAAKEKYGFLLNRVDEPEDCDFYFASLSYFGDLKVAVTTDGASPTVGQEVRNFIQRVLPKKLAALTQSKKEARKKRKIDIKETRQEAQKLLGHVYLIGCGIGDVELLTLKAYRLIQEVDVVFVDHLISEEIRAIIPATTKQVFVGKEKGRHSVNQDEINQLLLDYANQGLCIARLKSGDPYIFGRGAEEAMFLAEQGLRVDVVPGISSAISAPLSAGIAPTA
jgi:uroporphyrin-III C-methyltransferase/precorrin-2 dehydrogenase/sirohydrochlorin ferrochelatase